MRIVSESRCFEGRQLTLEHSSKACACPMRFALFLPPGAAEGSEAPALYFLSGLTCTEENFTVKAGAQRFAAETGLALVAPDTSPRNTGTAGEDALAPISNPSSSPWGRAAFSAYLGGEASRWREYDASELVRKAPLDTEILIDLGSADPFREEELKVEQFLAACRESGQKVNFRLRGGYDHGYFFVSTFIEAHLRHHASALVAASG